MNLKYNNVKQIISLIILINSTALGMIFLLIVCYLETKSSEYLYGLFFLLFIVLLDVLFFSIRKYLFSKVIIEDGKIKEIFWGKTLKEIDINDIKFLYVNSDNLFISSSEIEIKKIGEGRLLNKTLYSKQTIAFRMNLVRISNIFEFLQNQLCYVNSKVPKDVKEKINSYIDIEELQWEKKS